ncbi:MAG: SipW-dependent-type signal peptide-containing protein, partial [Microbacterium sp.]|uniref:SipW-dependent-type signal peptide-containing protein n=1 Tax=Microbacterium sp. TaxID=51671 RepID=UPI00282556B6
MTRRRLRTRRRGLALRRIRAVLAGGLVLGVGATVTLASWNDGEYATGTSTAGTFDVVGGIIGGGIFLNPGIAAQRTSSGLVLLGLWVGAGLLTL